MTDTKELSGLIEAAKRAGAEVEVVFDAEAEILEGRKVVESVTVRGLAGCGPCPMGPIAAAERLRELVGGK